MRPKGAHGLAHSAGPAAVWAPAARRVSVRASSSKICAWLSGERAVGGCASCEVPPAAVRIGSISLSMGNRAMRSAPRSDRSGRPLEELPLFVEFRHDSWDAPDLAEFMREKRLGFCSVDEPDLPGLL